MHRFTLHFHDGILSVSCPCGWTREWTIREEQQPLQILDGAEDEYDKHVKEQREEERLAQWHHQTFLLAECS
jgi:hypothetical protein